MNFSQNVLINKFHPYLKNRGREDFSSKLSPGYCHGLVLLFCYFAKIKKVDRFYELLKNANQWDDADDQRILEKINKIKETTEWQEAHKKFQTIEAKLKDTPQTYVDKIHEAKKEKLITSDEAKILLSAILPDDPDMEKMLSLVETLQRMQKYETKFSSSGSKLELIRDIDQSSSLFAQPYKEAPEFEDAIIISKENLHDLISRLPENRSIVLGSGRHAFAIIREKDNYTVYDSNSDKIIPDLTGANELAKYLLENTYKDNIGSHVPVSIEILAQENQDTVDYKDLKQFCDIYRKNENANLVKTRNRGFYPEDGITPLIISLTANLPKSAANLIDNNIGINTNDSLGFSPIHYAAFGGLTAIVKQLIDKGVDINQGITQASGQLNDVSLSLHDSIRNAPPLFFACVSNNLETVNMLLDNNADINKPSISGLTPLMAAVIQGHHELVKLLISRGAKLDSNIHILKDTEYQKKEIQSLTALEHFGAIYLPDYDGVNVTMLAAKQNQPKIVLELLKNGADIKYSNTSGMNLLHICVMNGILNQDILNYKPDVNSLVKFSSGSDQLISPLWIACYKNDIETVRLLLQNGANPNIKNENELSPLVKAVTDGSIELVKLLVNNGADVKIKSEGQTLLDIAIQNGRSHLVEFLFQQGLVPSADTNVYEGTLTLAIKMSRFKENQLESISNILSYMSKNNRPIPENLSSSAIGNDGLLLSIYSGLISGKLSSANQLCIGLTYMLDAYTNPASASSWLTMYSTDNSPPFLKLSDRLKQLDNPTFDAIKNEIQKTFNENKLNKHETIFLKALDRLVADFKLKPQANIKEIPTTSIEIKHQ